MQVEVHDEHFPQDCPDETWLVEVSERGWVVLTCDRRIAYRHVEQLAVASSGARVFLLVSGNLTGRAMAEAFVKAVGPMGRFLRRHQGPFIAKVYKDGSVKAWRGPEELG